MSLRAKKVLDFISIFLFCTLLLSLGMVWYSVEELEKAEDEVRQIEMERATSINKRLSDMLEKVENRDGRR